ncbi:MAG: SHOCT-like domain-containing protein [Betaproteobacteria bacterium]
MTEERRQILEMLANGKVTVDEAMKLLEAVETPQAGAAPAAEAPVVLGRGKTLRVRVVEGGKQKVNINVPFGLAKMCLGLATKYAAKDEKLKDLDLEEILRQVESGVTGRIVEVNDEDKLVEVYVE